MKRPETSTKPSNDEIEGFQKRLTQISETVENLRIIQGKRVSELEESNAALVEDTEALGRVISSLRDIIGTVPESKVENPKRGFISWPAPECENISDLRIMGVMDEFTASAVGAAAVLFQPPLSDWQADAEKFGPDILIIESAWQGNNGAWAEKVNRVNPELQALVSWCNDRGVPTVFWNKEDPVHYDSFIANATLFDFVYTTDLECISRYKRVLKHNRVFLMPFFGEPRLHNPLQGRREEGFSFAGAYYHRYSDRQANFEAIVDGVSDLGKVTIFDRNYGKELPQFTFPDKYLPMIAGSLPYTEIDTAYKGYEFGINLNSVKQSPTMFARRVFDLLLCDTHVVSNYSRGLRLLFGDLVVATDSQTEIGTRVSKLMGSSNTTRHSSYAAFIRQSALRKTMREHTTAERLAYMASKIWPDPPRRRCDPVSVISRVTNTAELKKVLSTFKQQTWHEKEIHVFLGEGVIPSPDQRSLGVNYHPGHSGYEGIEDIQFTGFVALWAGSSGYGKHYIEDAMHAFEYSNASAVSRVSGAEDPIGLASSYRLVDSAPLQCTVWKTSEMKLTEQFLEERGEAGPRIAGVPIVAIPSFDYASGVCDLVDTSMWEAADHGISISRLLEAAEQTDADGQPVLGDVAWSGSDLSEQFPSRVLPNRPVSLTASAGGLTLSSQMGAADHVYIYGRRAVPLGIFYKDPDVEPVLNVVTTPGLLISGVVRFLGRDGERLGSQVIPSDSNARLDVPPQTMNMQLGLRLQGSGSSEVHAISFGEVQYPSVSKPTPAAGEQLIVTNIYPSEGDLYRNAFVHSRAKAYQKSGLRPTVFVLNSRKSPKSYEYEGIDVRVGSADDLSSLLIANSFRSVLIHFLSQEMWEVLRCVIPQVPVVVWVHGAEIQPWFRRKFNFRNEIEIRDAQQASEQRMLFWREVLGYRSQNLHFVFVSNYFANEVMEDTGVRLAPGRFSIIHNYINSELFAYSDKNPDLRFNVLSIRPFASAKYANDVSVGAILALQKHPKFASSRFTLVGDGALFEETVAPIQNFSNVELRRTFLRQDEIARMHADYGIFLNPTRWDSQGVSRDEAMSSGLVPVTNAVSAVPEFVDQSSGVLVPVDDVEALADGIAELWDEPELFLKKSAAAAARVRDQSNHENTIAAEVRLILRLSVAEQFIAYHTLAPLETES